MLSKLIKNRLLISSFSFGLGLYANTIIAEKHPEIFLNKILKKKIANTKDLETKINIISFMDNPTNIINWLKISNNNNKLQKLSYEEWLDTIKKTKIYFLEKSLFGKISNIKDELAKKISLSQDANKSIEQILKIYGNTIECQFKIDEYIDNYIKNNKWIKYDDIKLLQNIIALIK